MSGEANRPPAPSPAPPAAPTTKLDVPFRTLAKIVLVVAAIWLLTKLWSLLLLLVISVLLAAALDPAALALEKRGWPRARAVGAVMLALLVAVIGVLAIVVPPLITQGRDFAENLPSYVEDAEGILADYPDVLERLRSTADQGAADPTTLFSGALAVGATLVGAVSNALIVLVLTVYLLVDGGRIDDWLLRYLPPGQRMKVRRALPEISRVVSGYVAGQLITSALFGIYTFAVLSLLGVPQAVLLAIVAAFADAIPIAGVLIATAPATLLAFTVSVPVGIAVFVLYIAYQQIENYVIVPRIYRSTLQISSFAVLIAVLVGAQLLGIVGVLLALPIAAAVPVVERIWLSDTYVFRSKVGVTDRPESSPFHPSPVPPDADADAPA